MAIVALDKLEESYKYLKYKPVFPKYAYDLVEFSYTPHKIIDEFFRERSFFVQTLIAPVYEEIFYRVLLQEGLFRQLPKMLIGVVDPQRANAIDSQMACIARVVLSSLLFSMAHMRKSCYDVSYVNFLFGQGLIFGGLQEAYKNPFRSMCWHFGVNAVPGIQRFARWITIDTQIRLRVQRLADIYGEIKDWTIEKGLVNKI